MPSFLTINDPVNKGATKTDSFRTEAEAQARVIELHEMGLTDAFYIDNNETAVNGVHCSHTGHHWVADSVTKTVTLDQASFDAEVHSDNMQILRKERNERLKESDKNVLPDRWVKMDDNSKTEWSDYRQSLRDLPANTPDPANPTWPTLPE